MRTRTYRGPTAIHDAETGDHLTDATAVLEPRIDGQNGCWGIITDHSAGELPPHLRVTFPDGTAVFVLVDWSDHAGTARVRGGPLPRQLLEATA
ncbi:MAG: hypothetical protein AB1Z57_02200 [Acidimicrobiia bacterium]